MKKDKNMGIMNDCKLSKVNFDTITDEELEQIVGGINTKESVEIGTKAILAGGGLAELKKYCQMHLGKNNILCKSI